MPPAPRRKWRALLIAGTALLVGSTAGIIAVQPAQGAELYVAPSGNDSQAGSSSAPLATVDAALAKAAPGDTITLRGGSYHQSVTVSKDNITIKAAAGESVVFDGTSVVTGWRKSGSVWIKDGWTTEFDSSPTYSWGQPDNPDDNWRFVNQAHPMAAHPDQVFYNGQSQEQVGQASEVAAGKFHVDYDKDQLTVGTDPNGKTVTASTIAKAMTIRGQNTTLLGFQVKGYAPSVPHMGAITLEKPGAKLTDIAITQMATTGLSAMADNITLTNVSSTLNGMLGIHASSAYQLTIDGATVNGNNIEHFNQAPVSGGIKVHKSRNVTIRNSTFNDNLANAIWFDVSDYNMKLANNRVQRNTGMGIFLEISDTASLVGNLVTNNGGHGIQINNTGHVEIWNNTLLGNARPLNIVQDDRDAADKTFPGYDERQPKPDPTVPWKTSEVRLSNNIVSDPTSAGNCLLCVEDYTHERSAEQMKITANGNLYKRISASSPQWLVVWSAGAGNPKVYNDLAAYKNATGQEAAGVLATQAVVDSEGRQTSYAASLEPTVAQPLPDAQATQAGQPKGAKDLGSWHGQATGGQTPANQAPTASFTSSTNQLAASFDGSGSSDADGSVASYAWDFGDGTTGSGRTTNKTYSAAGTYTVKLTVTDDDGATGTVSRSVTVSSTSGNSTGPTTLASDAYGRSTSSGWGAADTGGTWSTSDPASANVGSGLGSLVMKTADSGPVATLPSVSSQDTDLKLTLSLDKVPAGGSAGLDQSVLVRRVDNVGDYRAKLRFLPGGGVRLGLSRVATNGQQTVIVNETTVPNLTYTAGSTLVLRAQATGASPTTLKARVWQSGSTEPTSWLVSATDSTSGLQTAGSLGLHSYLGGGVTNAPIAARIDDLLATKDGSTPPNNAAPTAAFTTSSSGLTANVDGSTSSDSDGTIASYAWDFGDGVKDSGVTASHAYGAAGTYTVTLTVTDDDGATGTASKSVTVTAPAATKLASDAFGRTTNNGWGTADTGGAWTTTGGNNASRCAKGVGELTMAKANEGPMAYLTSGASSSTDLTVDFSLDKLPVGGSAGIDQGFMVRRVQGQGDYRAKVRVLPNGTVRLGIARTNSSGAQTSIVNEAVVSGLTYKAGEQLTVRVQAIGTSPTTLKAKVWRAGTTEPSSWMASGTDSTSGLQTEGTVGLHSFMAGDVTNAPIVARFDNLLATKP